MHGGTTTTTRQQKQLHLVLLLHWLVEVGRQSRERLLGIESFCTDFFLIHVIHFKRKGVLKNESSTFSTPVVGSHGSSLLYQPDKELICYRYNQSMFLLVCCSKLVHLVVFRGPPHQIGKV